MLEIDRPGAAHVLDLLRQVLMVPSRDAARHGWLPVVLGLLARDRALASHESGEDVRGQP